MEQKCIFYLAGYDSPSGYFRRWETDGEIEDVEYPYSGKQRPNWVERITVSAGHHIMLDCEPSDDIDEFVKLIRVPSDEEGFRAFCEKSRVADQTVYGRLLGYKHGPRFSKTPRDYNDDFYGEWLEEYVVRQWNWEQDGEDMPDTLVEALQS